MRVCVTGGLGFIGSTLVEHYLNRGDQVTVLDDESNPTVSPFENAALFYPGDAAKIGHYGAAWDLIVHCASPVGAVGVLKHKGHLAWKIMNETHAVVAHAVRHQVPLVNVSTSEVYGFSGRYHETDDLRVPSVPNTRIQYALGKLAAESECRLTPGLRSVSIRPFNVVGARQSSKGGFVLPTFVEQAHDRAALTVYGDGSQRRALTSVHDVARFIVGLQPEHFDGRVVNVGNPANETTISDLAYMVCKETGRTPLLEYTTGEKVHGPDYAEAEGHTKIPDITLAQSMGWEPVDSLPVIVREAVEVGGGRSSGSPAPSTPVAA